ncbi:hypothetical protein H4S04_005150 [Coemansia sp. S16]|nr:hypothetical protein GGI14_004547 [Coemansia sp. S680]KAJ2038280.1 hypothetical protein H4S03_002431 [Coemansia sp. S3946]KAJ2046250.1 hypothetical protein H4S04_005150 [Coemansia sp. S16]KAJ2052043.1 hypothetical protein GGI08_005116 [Coemansia sp. S2]KAJ2110556.1 hypothetical protein GGI16_000248 [Coemansia sp. S142-1]
MSRRVTNFDQEFFSKDSGFQSVHARTLPGRTMEYQGWFDSSSQWPRYQLPLAYNTYTGQQHVAVKPQRGYYPTIFSDSFFKPPPPAAPAAVAEKPPAKPPAKPPVVAVAVPSPAQIKDHGDRRELTITSDLFKEAKPSVQLKGRELRVHAAKVVTGTSKSGAVANGSDFEFKTVVPDMFNLAKIAAKREGAVLVITIPKK